MFIKEIEDNYMSDKDKLLDYGFSLKDHRYLLKKNLGDDFYVRFTIKDDTFEVRVYQDDEEYLPFYVKKMTGDYSTSIRIEVFHIIEDILDHCFIKINRRQEILDYVKAQYDTEPYYPAKDDNSCVLMVNNLSYGVLFTVSGSAFNLEEEGKVDIINIRADDKTIEKYVDHQIYFPAFSMDKKCWFTIVLNRKTDMAEVKKLIDESYHLMKNK